MEILKIREHGEWVDRAAEWFHLKWGIPKTAYEESMGECLKGKGGVPQWYIASEGDRIIGGMGVIENDFHDRDDLTPNVCAVYVDEDCRRRGIAGRLLDFVCNDMSGFGIDTLYLVTDHTGFYERYGWEFYCMVQGEGEPDMSRMYVHRADEPPASEPARQYYFMSKCRRYVKEFETEQGRRPTYRIQTLGCQMNARDSEKLEAVLSRIGYVEAGDAVPDFVLYNTCTVRENANLKVYGRLGYLKNKKRENPHMKIALCGCMMQEPAVVEKIKKSYPFVDIVFGTHNVYKLAELLYMRLTSERMVLDVWPEARGIVEDLPSKRKYPFKAGVNIMYGCDNFCSYCIVPYVRGRERSRRPEEILREIRGLVDEGVIEVMLLGQNVNSYGKKFDTEGTAPGRLREVEKTDVNFAALLREVEKIDGLKRIRFMTSHPKDLSDELIEVMAQSEKICAHLHLPLQSGSTKILQKMNRCYTKEDYLKLVERIRNRMPGLPLTTDLIVGFPGETEEDFEETLDVVRRVRFDSVYTFIYSKRTGTPAAVMEDQVPDEVVKDRFQRLLNTVQSISKQLCDSREGEIADVLMEEVNDHDSSRITGRLSSNATVHCKGTADCIGKICRVRLTESRGFYFMGEII